MSVHAGQLLLDGSWHPGRLVVEGGRIAAVERDEAAAGPEAPRIAPGLIDLHVHGFGGADPLEDLGAMARALARAGTTAFQPTLFPEAPERLGESARAVTAAAGALPDGAGAAVLGLHLEGPFVNPLSAGALPVHALAEPSIAALRAILGPATGDGRGIRTLTLAPELPGSDDLIEELRRAGVRVSLGHSRAKAEEARRAASAGATGVTHLFNAMSPWHHREAGLAGVALEGAGLHAELIGDLVHVGRHAIELALAARGPAGLCLVSDALRGAGTGCDVFHHLGCEHRLAGGAFRHLGEDGEPGPLAGAALSQLEAVRGLVAAGVVGSAEALTMASRTPAEALGDPRRGRLEIGARADFIVLDPNNLVLKGAWVAGVPQA